MDTKGFLCLVVPLGILSVMAGLAAEFKRAQATQVADLDARWRHCTYNPSPEYLGLVSATALVLVKVINNLASGCLADFCGGSEEGTDEPPLTCKRKALLFFSWSAFIIALILLLRGALLSNQREELIDTGSGNDCSVVPPGMFASGALLAALSLIFEVVIYRIINSKGEDANDTPIPNQVDIAMTKA